MSSLATCDMSNKLTECFDNEYRIIRVAGSGFCVFHHLCHYVTENQLSYAGITDDCAHVFSNIPELFRHRINLGVHNNSSLTVSDYDLLMREEFQRVKASEKMRKYYPKYALFDFFESSTVEVSRD